MSTSAKLSELVNISEPNQNFRQVEFKDKLTSPSLPSTSSSRPSGFLQRLRSRFPFRFKRNTQIAHFNGIRPRSHRVVHMKTACKNPLSPSLMAPINTCPRRLIDTDTLKLVGFRKDVTIPPYAILSHRWILGEEIVYDEFNKPREETSSKSGYQKIQAACQQARKDNIRYIWIDTCCIEQGNHDDVAANITSMYAYYQNAEVCYVYLADVKEKGDMCGAWVMQSSFMVVGGSEWLWRGWTLQELLAPRTVIFFNKDWQCIGDKHELRDDIYQRTLIPRAVLSSEQSIRDVDVLTRMSWAAGRRTTKEQDRAYCLQGLLGISVEPNYDEAWWTSFNRLGKALFDAHPELKGRLEISDDIFCDPNNFNFYVLVHGRFEDNRNEIWALHFKTSEDDDS
ncbi:hypothetical protein VKT23_017234 [Stygiomarasmius scandens]|uniref:Heterokaryon incompatibility domain-containing protein n=1 Tax=Marasmiellus scandens TaxID=2682957 RepID=A0ABR1ITY5_9AGAR